MEKTQQEIALERKVANGILTKARADAMKAKFDEIRAKRAEVKPLAEIKNDARKKFWQEQKEIAEAELAKLEK